MTFPQCTFPNISRSEIVWQLIFVSFVEDCFFYWNHRISHQFKFLYKFHKVHHQYTETFSLVTEFTHPVDYLFGILVISLFNFRFHQPCRSFCQEVELIVLCFLCGNSIKCSLVLRDILDMSFLGVQQEYSSLFLDLPSTIFIIVKILALIVGVFIYGIISMIVLRFILVRGIRNINRWWRKKFSDEQIC